MHPIIWLCMCVKSSSIWNNFTWSKFTLCNEEACGSQKCNVLRKTKNRKKSFSFHWISNPNLNDIVTKGTIDGTNTFDILRKLHFISHIGASRKRFHKKSIHFISTIYAIICVQYANCILCACVCVRTVPKGKLTNLSKSLEEYFIFYTMVQVMWTFIMFFGKLENTIGKLYLDAITWMIF